MHNSRRKKAVIYFVILIIFSSLLFEGSPIYAEDQGTLTYVKQEDNEFALYGKLPDGKIIGTAFAKKNWGTWNIDGWFVSEDRRIPSAKMNFVAGTSTDWEYVYRVSDTEGSCYRFSGGNHGLERMKDLSVINLDNNKPIDINKKQKLNIRNCLQVVEKTILYSDGECSKPYAEVTRIYYVKPGKIQLETYTTFTRDIYMGTSYVCMFPVSKKYGGLAHFVDTGHTFETPEYGTTNTNDGFENFIGKEATLSVIISSKKENRFKFRVSIGNAEMVDNFNDELKTFYWDLNKFSNKLYFSKYDNDKYLLVAKNTSWYQKNRWELITDANPPR